MARRLIITAGWLAAAVLAVLVGLVAVSVIGDGLVSPLAEPMSESEVARDLASAPPPSSQSPTTPSSSAPGAVDRTFPTRAGLVIGRCENGRATVELMSPYQGFDVHERNGSEGEFRGVSDNHDRVKVGISCDGDEPEIDVESRDD